MNNLFNAPVFDFNRSRSLSPLDAQLEPELFEDEANTALLTLAFLLSSDNPMKCDRFGLAASQLAMFAAGPHAVLAKSHYLHLQRTVDEYKQYCEQLSLEQNDDAPKFSELANYLQFILDHAKKRFECQNAICFAVPANEARPCRDDLWRANPELPESVIETVRFKIPRASGNDSD